jgi:thioesterase-3
VSEEYRIKIRGYHLDQYGHLNIGAYTQFMEEARWTLFENYGADNFFSELDLALTLVNSNINYRRPCFLGDLIEVDTKVLRIGTTSCKVAQIIYLDGGNSRVADAEHTFVLMDKKTLKSRKIEGAARDKLEQLAQI